MTYPLTNTDQLLDVTPIGVPLFVRDNHGNQLELAGVEDQLNANDDCVGFVLVVAPKEEKT